MPIAGGGTVISGSGQIADGIIINDDISASAAIAYSKLALSAALQVADLANGTDGELITWDAAGAATTIAAGTSGQVLTSNGAGAAPTFQTAGAGNLIALSTTPVASNSDETIQKDVASESIAGGTLGTGNAIRIRVYFDSVVINGSSFTVDLNLGATTIATITLSNQGSTNVYKGYIEGIIFADGATNAQKGTLQAYLGVPATDVHGEAVEFANEFGNGTAAEDSTGVLTLAINIDADGNGSSSFNTIGYIVEKIA